MTILAVIPCLNEAAHLPALIEQMVADPAIDMLVVADGGSTDGSQAIVRRLAQGMPKLLALDNPARLQSAGINRAVRLHGAGHEWLLRIDAHCRYPDGYASMLMTAARATGASAVVVPMVTSAARGFARAAAAAQNSVLGTGGSAHRHLGSGRWVDHGHHALMRLDMFHALGGYCENMPCNEDAELDHRQTSVGGRVWLEPKAAIMYFPRSRPIALARQYYRYGVGRARTIRRHRLRPHLRQMAPLAVPFAALLALLTPWSAWAAVPFLLWAALCLSTGLLVGFRAGGGWAYAAGIAAAIMHMSWGTGFLKEMLLRPKGSDARYGLSAPS